MRSVVILLLTATACLGGELKPKPGSENPVKPGQLVWIEVKDITVQQLAKGVFHAFPTKNVMVIPGQTWSGQPYVIFQASAKGAYMLAVCVSGKDGAVETAQYVVQVGDSPGPGPDPGPDPTPHPGGPYQIMFFYPAGERDNLPQGQRDILFSVKLREQLEKDGHAILEVMDSKALNKPIKRAYEPFFETARNVKLPAVVVAPMKGGRVIAQPLPKDPAGLLELLKSTKLGIATSAFVQGDRK